MNKNFKCGIISTILTGAIVSTSVTPVYAEEKNAVVSMVNDTDHSVVRDKDLGGNLFSVKFITTNEKTGKKVTHKFKEEAMVGQTPGAAYAIVYLGNGIYGQLSIDRKTGNKLIIATYDLVNSETKKVKWNYTNGEIVEVK